MRKDIVKNAVICLSHLEIEDTTYKIARDIVIEEYEQQKEEIERLNNIINELEKCTNESYKYYKNELIKCYESRIEDKYLSGKQNAYYEMSQKIKELKGDSNNE